MILDIKLIPNDVETLKAMLVQQHRKAQHQQQRIHYLEACYVSTNSGIRWNKG